MEELKTFLRKKDLDGSKDHIIPHTGYFYASEALKCPRAIYYARLFPEEKPDKLLGVFFIGETIHQLFQKILKEARPDLVDEAEIRIKLPNGIEVSGRADLMGDTEILELKTVADIKYSLKEASLHHKGQLVLYLSQHKDKKGRVIYIDKRNLETVSHDVLFDDVIYLATINNFANVKRALDEGKPPAKSEMTEDWQCRYCDHRELCAKADKSDMTLESF